MKEQITKEKKSVITGERKRLAFCMKRNRWTLEAICWPAIFSFDFN